MSAAATNIAPAIIAVDIGTAHAAAKITDRLERFFGGWHCALAASSEKGRHLIAARDFACGETVLISEAYLTALFPSFKKRICAACLRDGGRRLELRCASCGEAWYCSDGCREAHTRGMPPPGLPPQPHGTPRIPHALLCPVLKQFGGLKADADMECIIRMCLDLLALQQLAYTSGGGSAANGSVGSAAGSGNTAESGAAASGAAGLAGERDAIIPAAGSAAVDAASPVDTTAGDAAATSSCPTAGSQSEAPPASRHPPPPRQSHADFELLQYHPGALSERDAQQWRRATAFLQTALRRAGWKQEAVPSQQVLLTWVGRVAANSFGLHIDAAAAAAVARDGSGPEALPLLPPQQKEPLAAAAAAAGGSARTLPIQAGHVAAGLNREAYRAGKLADAQAGNDHALLSQLQRLQLAQRRRWEGDEDAAAEAAEAATAPHPAEQQRLADSSSGESPAASVEGGPAPTAMAVSFAGDSFMNRGLVAEGGSSDAVEPAVVVAASDGAAVPDSGIGSSAAAGASQVLGPSGSSGLGVADRSAQGRSEPVGRELFISASFFNHRRRAQRLRDVDRACSATARSCQPNCIIRRHTAFGVVTAQADIQAGSELCISYIDLDIPRSARQAELRKFFHFTCDCSRCQQEEAEGSGKCSYSTAAPAKSGKDSAPKRRGRKARISRA